MEPARIVFLLTDGQDTWLFEDIETALEHIRQGVLNGTQPGDEYHIDLTLMTDAEIKATPEQ